MKRSTIILLIVIALCTAMIMGTLIGSNTSAGFNEAFAQPGKEFKVSGVLVKNEDVIYDPEANASLTTFFLEDSEGNVRKVELSKSKPPGFEQSESLVLYGYAEDETFHANDLLMKCPSKYNADTHSIETTAQNQE